MTLADAPWPYGHGRPGPAGLSAALGFVLAAPYTLAGIAGQLSRGGRGSPFLVGCLLAAVGLVLGGRWLLGGRGRGVLVGSACAGAAASCLAWTTDPETASEGTAGTVWWVMTVLPPPVVVVALAAAPRVTGWLRGDPVRTPAPGTPPPGGLPAGAWTYGPPRPDAATASAVLALAVAGVVGHPTGTVLLGDLALGELPTPAEVAVLFIAAALVAGAVLLLRRRSRAPLLAAVGSAAVLAVALAVAVPAGPAGGGTVLLALVLVPLAVAAALAARRSVGRWLAGR